MANLRISRSALLMLARAVATLCFSLSYFALGQDYFSKEVRIDDLPQVTAKSRDASDVLAASVEIIFHDKEICCGRNSALGDAVQAPDPKALKEVGARLQGRHPLSDGRPILVTADYVPAATVNPEMLIVPLTQKRALLMEWNSHLYVAYGVSYVVTIDPDSGGTINAIRTIFLIDPRFSDDRRQVTFNRQTDDWGKVQGILMLKAAPQ